MLCGDLRKAVSREHWSQGSDLFVRCNAGIGIYTRDTSANHTYRMFSDAFGLGAPAAPLATEQRDSLRNRRVL